MKPNPRNGKAAAQRLIRQRDAAQELSRQLYEENRKLRELLDSKLTVTVDIISPFTGEVEPVTVVVDGVAPAAVDPLAVLGKWGV